MISFTSMSKCHEHQNSLITTVTVNVLFFTNVMPVESEQQCPEERFRGEVEAGSGELPVGEDIVRGLGLQESCRLPLLEENVGQRLQHVFLELQERSVADTHVVEDGDEGSVQLEAHWKGED